VFYAHAQGQQRSPGDEAVTSLNHEQLLEALRHLARLSGDEVTDHQLYYVLTVYLVGKDELVTRPMFPKMAVLTERLAFIAAYFPSLEANVNTQTVLKDIKTMWLLSTPTPPCNTAGLGLMSLTQLEDALLARRMDKAVVKTVGDRLRGVHRCDALDLVTFVALLPMYKHAAETIPYHAPGEHLPKQNRFDDAVKASPAGAAASPASGTAGSSLGSSTRKTKKKMNRFKAAGMKIVKGISLMRAWASLIEQVEGEPNATLSMVGVFTESRFLAWNKAVGVKPDQA